MQLLLLTCVDKVLFGLRELVVGKNSLHLLKSIRLHACTHIEEWVGREVEVLLDETERH